MRKKILTLALAAILTVSMVVPTFASEVSEGGDQTSALAGTINVKVAIADQGEFAVAKDGTTQMTYVDVMVSDQNENGIFDIDDALYCVHETYYEGGAEAGYASGITQYGRSLTELWGDTSGSFGYYVNNNSAWSLDDEVAEGDLVYAFIYKDQTSWSDKYSYFDESSKTVKAGESFELTLTALGYDASWQIVASPYANAGITEDGISIDCQTDENGKVSLSLDEAGTYIISAYTSNDNDIIVPPICVVTVKATEANVKIAIADQGEIATDKDGAEMAYVDVNVTDHNANGILDIDDALYYAHEAYYEGGAEAGYASGITQYGRSLTELWGDTSGSFGYYVNNNSAWSLDDEVAEGDLVYAFIYKDQTSWSDKYSYFDYSSKTVEAGKSFDLSLSAAGYDEYWNPVASAYEGAAISVDGQVIESIKTDEEGKVSICLNTPGLHVISAEASNGTDILVPPICVVAVAGEIAPITDTFKETSNYIFNNTEMTSANEWRIMSLAKEGLLSDEQTDEFYNSEVEKFTSGKTLAATEYEKSILALTTIGKDVTNVGGVNLLEFIANGENVKQINAKIYALLAFDCNNYQIPSGSYTSVTREGLVSDIIDLQKEDGGWNYSASAATSDVDMTAMALQALAPYADIDEANNAIEEAESFLYTALFTGKVTSCESFAQTILALNALEADPTSAVYKQTVSGLLTYYNGDGRFCYNGSPNELSTTQAYEALVDHRFEEIGTVSDETQKLCICPVCLETRCISEGKTVTSLTGLAKVTTKMFGELWLNFENGVVNEITGLVQKAGGSDSNWYYVKNGVLTEETGFVKVDSDKYYVKNGVLVEKTGFVTVNSNKYYVKNGKLIRKTGFVTVNSNKYYVKNGKLVKKTGLVKVGSYKYYLKNGKLIKKTGLVKINSKWYYLNNGKFVKKTGFVKKAGSTASTKYYVKNGVFQKVTKIVKINGKKYKVVKGIYKGRVK